MLVIAGAARAKGFLLDGYGVFFDVDVPAMRRSVAWSFRQLGRPTARSKPPSRRFAQPDAVNDPAVRREMDEAIQRLSRIVGPVPCRAAPRSPASSRSRRALRETPR